MLRLLALAALVVVAGGGWTGARAAPPDAGPTASPEGRKVSLRPGESAVFSIDAPEAGSVRWQLDGTTVGAGPAWTFEPGAGDIGRHVVRLAVAGPTGVTRRRWDVRVRPPRLPRVAVREPATEVVSVVVGREVVLRFDATPATPGETVRIAWTVDGAPAGEGDTLRWSASEPADVRARALAMGSLGAVVGQEWRIQVQLPTTTTTSTTTTSSTTLPTTSTTTTTTTTTTSSTPPTTTVAIVTSTTTSTVRPATTSTSTSTTTTRPPAPSTTLPPPPPPPPPRETRQPQGPAGSVESEVRRLLDRYAAAYRNRDVVELRRIGQVTSDSQAADLARYFDKIGNLDVEVDVIEIRPEGDGATVRFTRRDRFRDPTGRIVTQQTPPIQKRIVRGPDGLRFEPAAR